MTISEIIDALEFNNLYKNRLLITLLRNHNDYHRYLKYEYLKLCIIDRDLNFKRVIEIILECSDEITINFLIKSFKEDKDRIIKLIR